MWEEHICLACGKQGLWLDRNGVQMDTWTTVCVYDPNWVCETAWACKHFVQDVEILSSAPLARASLMPAVPGPISQQIIWALG